MEDWQEQVAAIVLAAGMSTRMGQPKMALPWKDTTVIGQVVRTILSAGIDSIIVVTGAGRETVYDALSGIQVNFVDNPAYQTGEMLSSIQAGLAALPPQVQGALVCLGDQPHIQPDVIRTICRDYGPTSKGILIPSYQRRRGHPMLVDRALWPEILSLKQPATLRDFINSRPESVGYTEVLTDSILRDLDTPEDYHSDRPA